MEFSIPGKKKQVEVPCVDEKFPNKILVYELFYLYNISYHFIVQCMDVLNFIQWIEMLYDRGTKPQCHCAVVETEVNSFAKMR
jgi:hypothetical protein